MYGTNFMVDITGLPDSFFIGHVVSGQSTLFSPYASYSVDSVVFDPAEAPPIIGSLLRSRNRKLKVTPHYGVMNTIAVRVVAPDSTTSSNETKLSDKIFGTYGDLLNLKSGYKMCSYDQLFFEPTNHSIANNGVVTITTSQNVIGISKDTVVNTVFNNLKSLLGGVDPYQVFDNILLCLPPNTGIDGWVGVAVFGGQLSWYNDDACISPSVLLHELGHNLYLDHSNDIDGEYGDASCTMGFGFPYDEFPYRCFNGPKSYVLGWYSSRTLSADLLSLTTPLKATLIGTADFNNTKNHPSYLVVIKIESGQVDFYVNFNRKTGINKDTYKYEDKVVVSYQGKFPDTEQSWVYGSMSNADQNVTVFNIAGTKYDVIVQVDSLNLTSDPAIANVTVSCVLSSQKASAFDNTVFKGAFSQWLTNKTASDSLYGPIESWNTSLVTNLDNLFYNLTSFQENVSAWDVSSVTSMYRTFMSTWSFNGDLSRWATSKVTNMQEIFRDARVFNGNISTWDVSSVNKFSYSFYGASAFNGDLSLWNPKSAQDFSWMFVGADNFFPSNLTKWNTTSATRFQGMFMNSKFNADISSWQTPYLVNMDDTFRGCSNFTGNLGSWDVSRVTSMWSTFRSASKFNCDLSAWNTQHLLSMDYMFNDAIAFNGNIGSWNVSSVTSAYQTFRGATLFNSDLSSWSLVAVTNIAYMFNGASSFQSSNLNKWNTSKVRDFGAVFSNSNFNGNISGWNTGSATSMWYMFNNCPFAGSVAGWNTEKVTDFSYMFQDATTFNSDVSQWTMTSALTAVSMFSGAANFTSDVSSWNVNKVTNMAGMFRSTNKFNSDIRSWVITAVTSMNSMFYNAKAFNQTICFNLTGKDITNAFTGSKATVKSFPQCLPNWPTFAPTSAPTYCPRSQLLNVTISHDWFPEETSWNVTSLSDLSTVASNNGHPSNLDVNIICVTNPNGCYNFTILDSWGDGICCGNGQGWYEVSFQGSVVVSNFAFKNSSVSTKFCSTVRLCLSKYTFEAS